jgi:Uncharacterized protein conserved in bacteria
MTTPSPSRITFVLLTLTACGFLAASALADSQVRIVRLSDVQGSVQMDKNTGSGFERAFVNLPIIQGSQVRTGNNGRVEIEFEDGSSLRLAPNTTVQFSKLALSDSGKRMSQVDLTGGMAYINWLGKDDLALNFSHETVSLNHSAHFRVDTSTQAAELAVFNGNVEVEGPSGKVTVEKKRTATFDAADNDKYTVAKKVAEEPLDSWDKESVSYHDQYAKNNSTPYGYGYSDLNYYGAFANVPGYGMMWQPYFTGVDGIRLWMARGATIPASDTCLPRLIRGDGCRIATETGCSFPTWVGCGSRAAGIPGSQFHVTHRRPWSA